MRCYAAGGAKVVDKLHIIDILIEKVNVLCPMSCTLTANLDEVPKKRPQGWWCMAVQQRFSLLCLYRQTKLSLAEEWHSRSSRPRACPSGTLR